MLRTLVISVILIVMCSFQSEDPQWAAIQRAIGKGDATALSSHFSSIVTLSIPGNQGNFSSKQARTIMHCFFKSHPPKSITLKTAGQKSSSSQYYLCRYEDTQGTPFTMYMLMQTDSKQSEIIQLTIEKSS